MLPDESAQPWPPASWAPIQQSIAEADAWYSGDETKLAGIYGGVSPTRSRWAKFWSRRSTGEPSRGQRLHVPAASDVAATAADLLFGEPPTWTIPDAHADGADPQAKAVEERLNELAVADGWASILLEGAEVASGLGGVFLRPTWDTSVADHPILSVIHPDTAVPEFRYGKLVAVTFWRLLEQDHGVVWRHLERHTPGLIEHGLYRGSIDSLGARHDLRARADTAALADDGGGVDLAPFGITGLLPAYVPNVRPNRRHRTVPVGRADCDATTVPLMDALDEVWSSWIRDIRLGKARLIVPNSMLDRRGRGQGAAFDTDQEVFSPLEIDPAQARDAGINPVQFALRVAEHEQTARALFTQVVQTAGYSPQSFGLQGEGSAQTATEVDARADRSMRTTARKQGYWKPALEHAAFAALAIDRAVFGGPVEPMRPQVDFPAAAETELRDTASTLNLLSLAKAASTETKVRMLNPEWTEDQVAAEVARIVEEQATPVADPTGGFV